MRRNNTNKLHEEANVPQYSQLQKELRDIVTFLGRVYHWDSEPYNYRKRIELLANMDYSNYKKVCVRTESVINSMERNKPISDALDNQTLEDMSSFLRTCWANMRQSYPVLFNGKWLLRLKPDELYDVQQALKQVINGYKKQTNESKKGSERVYTLTESQLIDIVQKTRHKLNTK